MLLRASVCVSNNAVITLRAPCAPSHAASVCKIRSQGVASSFPRYFKTINFIRNENASAVSAADPAVDASSTSALEMVY